MPRPALSDLPPPHLADAARLQIVDAARGCAIAQMVAYHFCYDLHYFGWIHLELTSDPAWIAWRSAIVTQFLFLVGVSLSLRGAAAGRTPPAPPLLTRRWWQIAACAALVSAGSALLFGPRWIWFGVLHFVALVQLLVWPLPGRAAVKLVLGGAALALGLGVQLNAFAPDSLSWIGFSPVKPRTEDFVPLLPWLGVVLLGNGAGQWWQASAGAGAQRLRAFTARRSRWLLDIGRWPLTIYMVHQPLLMGILYVLRAAQRGLA